MRALVDIPDDQIRALARIGDKQNLSRAALVRRAIADLIATEGALSASNGFGLWNRREDGLAYENRIRGEW